MKKEFLAKKIIEGPNLGPASNGSLPKNSLEGVTWLYLKRELDKVWEIIPNEVLTINGIKLESHSLLSLYLGGPDTYGRFQTELESEGKKLRVRLRFLRKNGTEWLPKEVSSTFNGGIYPRFRMTLESVDPAEGFNNPRVKNQCDFCGQESTEMFLSLDYEGKIVLAGVILHCGHFQVKWVHG